MLRFGVIQIAMPVSPWVAVHFGFSHHLGTKNSSLVSDLLKARTLQHLSQQDVMRVIARLGDESDH